MATDVADPVQRHRGRPFQKGQSGNPKGRPPGLTKAAKLREAIAKDLGNVVAAMVKAAKGGDTAAAKLLLDRCLPPLKPVDIVDVDIGPLPPGLTEKARALINAALARTLPASTAADLVGAIGTAARVEELLEIRQRLDQLERRIIGEPVHEGPAGVGS
jgi:hypothetical protein